jgi:hypothetical protein
MGRTEFESTIHSFLCSHKTLRRTAYRICKLCFESDAWGTHCNRARHAFRCLSSSSCSPTAGVVITVLYLSYRLNHQELPLPKTKLNTVSLVRERTIPTEPRPLAGEISGNSVPRDQCDGSLRPYSWIFRSERLMFLLRSSSVVLTRLNGPLWETHYLSENLVVLGIEFGRLDL